MKKLLIVSIAAIISNIAMAAELPSSIGFDQRVTSVPYQVGNVVELNLTPGIATHIVLEKGEEYKAHAFGDSEAWHFTHFENNLFIKPAKPLGTTNLTVLTNKRDYVFQTVFNQDMGLNQLFQVRFEYPEVLTKEKIEEIEQGKVEEKLEKAKTKKIYNLNYLKRGSESIAPVNVYDDGTFTYFKFPGNVDLPAIYAVDYTGGVGKESLVNKTVMGEGNNTIAMHKVHYAWRLRLDSAVLDVKNDSLDWKGVLNKSGTIADDVQRVSLNDEMPENIDSALMTEVNVTPGIDNDTPPLNMNSNNQLNDPTAVPVTYGLPPSNGSVEVNKEPPISLEGVIQAVGADTARKLGYKVDDDFNAETDVAEEDE